MATKTFYFKDATASGSAHGSLQEAGTAPTAVNTVTGWLVGKSTAGNFQIQQYNNILTNAGFSTTDTLNTATSTNANNAWRSENTMNGVFANTTWTINGLFRAATAGTQSGRLNVKVFKSPNANGTANVTVIDVGGGKLVGSNTGAMGSTTTDYTSIVTFTPAAPIQMYNEYLFIACQWETTVAGDGNNRDTRWRVGPTCNVVTSDFTVRNKSVAIL